MECWCTHHRRLKGKKKGKPLSPNRREKGATTPRGKKGPCVDKVVSCKKKGKGEETIKGHFSDKLIRGSTSRKQREKKGKEGRNSPT